MLELADMSEAELQARKEKCDIFSSFDETLLSHGFATFFAVTSPWVCSATLLGILLQIIVDMKCLMDSTQRPIPIKARRNEPCGTAFDIYGLLAASTNIFLLIFASHEYDSWTLTEKLVLFIYLEHMVIFTRLLLKLVFPLVPRNVELLQLKQDNMVHRCLENIKVEHNQDFSMFRDHRGEQIHVFDQDILEREAMHDNPEEVEPTFDLSGSLDAMVRGIKFELIRLLPT